VKKKQIHRSAYKFPKSDIKKKPFFSLREKHSGKHYAKEGAQAIFCKRAKKGTGRNQKQMCASNVESSPFQKKKKKKRDSRKKTRRKKGEEKRGWDEGNPKKLEMTF